MYFSLYQSHKQTCRNDSNVVIAEHLEQFLPSALSSAHTCEYTYISLCHTCRPVEIMLMPLLQRIYSTFSLQLSRIHTHTHTYIYLCHTCRPVETMLTSLSRSIWSTSSVPEMSAEITSPGIKFLLRPVCVCVCEQMCLCVCVITFLWRTVCVMMCECDNSC